MLSSLSSTDIRISVANTNAADPSQPLNARTQGQEQGPGDETQWNRKVHFIYALLSTWIFVPWYAVLVIIMSANRSTHDGYPCSFFMNMYDWLIIYAAFALLLNILCNVISWQWIQFQQLNLYGKIIFTLYMLIWISELVFLIYGTLSMEKNCLNESSSVTTLSKWNIGLSFANTVGMFILLLRSFCSSIVSYIDL